MSWLRGVLRFSEAMVWLLKRAIKCFCCLSKVSTDPLTPDEAWRQLLPVADLPDACSSGPLSTLPALADAEPVSGFVCFNALPCSYTQRPGRPDLPYQV